MTTVAPITTGHMVRDKVNFSGVAWGRTLHDQKGIITRVDTMYQLEKPTDGSDSICWKKNNVVLAKNAKNVRVVPNKLQLIVAQCCQSQVHE